MNALAESNAAVTAFLSGVVGVVDANSFERLCLWQERGEKTWVDSPFGHWLEIGSCADMPVCVNLSTVVIGGHKILFIDPTSQVVDYRMIDAWLERGMPSSARTKDQKLNRTDAMNIHNVFPR